MYILAILVALSLNAIAQANQVTFVKLNKKIYVETGPSNYAFYGQVLDNDGIRILTINGTMRRFLTSGCKTGWHDLLDSDLNDYFDARGIYLKVEQKSPILSGIPTNTYKWSDDDSNSESNQQAAEFSVVKLDEETLVFTSKYFPGDVVKVITSGNIITFIHEDGDVVMKTIDCLMKNEKKLLAGIKKIDTSGKKFHVFPRTTDEVLKKYLKSHSINEDDFSEEQRYQKIHTPEELAAMDRAVRGGSVKSFAGGWSGNDTL